LLLAERKHVNICKWILEVFPISLGFNPVEYYFWTSISNELFKIQFHKLTEIEKESLMKDYDNVVTFPLNIGCTGLAISEKRTIYFNEG